MNSIQNFALVVQILAIFEIFFQWLLNCCEEKEIQKLKREGMDNTSDVLPLEEPEKRKKNIKQVLVSKILAWILFIMILGAGINQIPKKQCPDTYGLNNGICVNC